MVDVGKEVSLRMADALDKQDQDNVKNIIQPKVKEVTYVQGDDLKAWQKLLLAIEDQWIQQNEAKGIQAKKAIEERNKAVAKFAK